MGNRRLLNNIKERFEAGNREAFYFMLKLIRYIIISSIYLVAVVPFILICDNLQTQLYIAILVMMTVLYNIALFWKRTGDIYEKIALRIVRRLGKYGNVISKEDWKKVKANNPEMYKILVTDKSKGYCYFMTRYLAFFLDDAEIVYCSISIDEENNRTAHSVIKKGKCIYCTNARIHIDYEEWMEELDAVIYRTFSKEEYTKKDFFDTTNDDFIKWCEENDTYCSPQVSPVSF